LQIFLVGTAHVSKQSAVEVREMIRLVKPDTVMVELCPERAARLRAGGSSDQDFLKVSELQAQAGLCVVGSIVGCELLARAQAYIRMLLDNTMRVQGMHV
jgi:pheromone shutdown protein TraB